MINTSRDKERGATLAETALILPILVAVLVGTMEIGLAFRDYMTISYATREGARVGALTGNSLTADCEITTSVVDTIGAGNMGKFQYLEIYEVSPSTGNPVGPGSTNTWTFTGSDPYDCVNDWTVVENWASTDRKTSFAPGSQLDILGVRIVYQHDWVTDLPPFSGTFDIDEATITRLEPESFE